MTNPLDAINPILDVSLLPSWECCFLPLFSQAEVWVRTLLHGKDIFGHKTFACLSVCLLSLLYSSKNLSFLVHDLGQMLNFPLCPSNLPVREMKRVNQTSPTQLRDSHGNLGFQLFHISSLTVPLITHLAYSRPVLNMLNHMTAPWIEKSASFHWKVP